MSTIKIPMDERTAAFYKGAAAGGRAQDYLADNRSEIRTKAERVAMFWLLVGRDSTAVSPLRSDADAAATYEDLLSAFLQGAALRAPTK